MQKITQSITLDLVEIQHNIISARQGDQLVRDLIITITNNGHTYPIPEDADVRLRGARPDGKYVLYDCTDNLDEQCAVTDRANGIVHIDIPDYLLSSSGRAYLDIGIYQDVDGQKTEVASTETFILYIPEKIFSEEDVVNSPEASTLNELIRTTKEFDEKMSKNEDTRQTNESMRQDGYSEMVEQINNIQSTVNENKTVWDDKYTKNEVDNKLDRIASGYVTGIKGDKESSYRTGNVNLTPDNIGAAPMHEVTQGDFNDMKTPGLYTMKNAVSNKPASNKSYYALIVLKSDSGNYVEQIAFAENTHDIYIRTLNSNTWSNWRKLQTLDSASGATESNCLTLFDGVHSRNVIAIYDDEDGANDYGSELVMTAFGNTFIGSGDSSPALRATLQSGVSAGEAYGKTNERLYLSSDEQLYFYSNCNTIGSRKGMYFNNGSLTPLTANGINIGSSSLPFNNLYTKNITATSNVSIGGNLSLANSKLNNLGDDCQFGDMNAAGKFCIKGVTGNTGIQFITKGSSSTSNAGAYIDWNGSNFEFSKPVKTESGIYFADTGGDPHIKGTYNSLTVTGGGSLTSGFEILDCGKTIEPYRSSAQSYSPTFGTSVNRWAGIYCSSFSNTGSDRKNKKDITPMSTKKDNYLKIFDELEFVKYRWKENQNGAAASQPSSRFHLGFIAQDVEKTLQDNGIDNQDSGIITASFFANNTSKTFICGGYKKKKEGYDYSENVYNYKHDLKYEWNNEIIEKDLAELNIYKMYNTRNTIGYIMFQDISKVAREGKQPPLKVNSITLVDHDDNYISIPVTADGIPYYNSYTDLELTTPLSHGYLDDNGSLNITWDKMWGTWMMKVDAFDFFNFKKIILDIDYIGEYKVYLIPDGDIKNANVYDRHNNDQILYEYGLTYDEIELLSLYALQETRKEFNEYKAKVDKILEQLGVEV